MNCGTTVKTITRADAYWTNAGHCCVLFDHMWQV